MSDAVLVVEDDRELLTTLAATSGRVFSRYELVNRVRGYEFAG